MRSDCSGRDAMADINIHIGEMLARNARMYPDEIALIESAPSVPPDIKLTQGI